MHVFSVRIPDRLYMAVLQHGLDNDIPTINASVMGLLRSGLAKQELENEVIKQFILEVVPKEKLQEIINGKPVTPPQ